MEIVEHYNFFTKRRHDLFHCFDILAIKQDQILGVQTTSTSNMSAREKKIMNNPIMHKWLMAGGDIVLHGWSKKGPRGKAKRWVLTEKVLLP